MATITDTKQTKIPLFHRVSTSSTKSMAENDKKMTITTDNNYRQRNSVMERDNNFKKIAITNVTDNKLPLLRGIDQNRPLAAIIQDIAEEWQLSNPSDYALLFTEPNRQMYMTEKNRSELQNGNVLLLTWSPEKTAKDLYHSLKDGKQEERIESLKKLVKLATDMTFAHEFINKQGHMLIIQYVIDGKNPGEPMSFQLKSFLALMEHGVVDWDILEQDFTKRIVDFIISQKTGISSLQPALEILENIVLHSSDLTKHPVIEQHITPEKIQTHIQRTNLLQRHAQFYPKESKYRHTQVYPKESEYRHTQVYPKESEYRHTQVYPKESEYRHTQVYPKESEYRHTQVYPKESEDRHTQFYQNESEYSNEVQKNAIALLNALFIKAAPEKRRKIANSVQSRDFRNCLMSSVFGSKLGSEMAHQIYKLQTLLLNMYEEKMMTPADPNSATVHKIIEFLRKPVLEIDSESNQTGNRKSNVYKKLGFENFSTPAEDFVRHTPPGVLALDNVHYFAQYQEENYVKVVLENSCREDKHDCPFIRSSIMITRVLCDILKIGEPPSDEGKTYYPMFFSDCKAFEKLFCICIQLLNKTWREMRASEEDFPKVLCVVKEQITRALQVQPSSLEVLKNQLQKLTYQDILKLWEQERQTKEEWESQAKPIIELREHIAPDMINMIKQQRLNFLMDGSKFTKYNFRGKVKDKYWYWRLAPNHKSFLFADCGENEDVVLDDLTNKLPITEIKCLLTGKDCPHTAKKKAGISPLFFAIQPAPTSGENTESYCFVAKDEVEFDMWTDGINVLLGIDMESGQKNKDLELLLNMETKIHLLDIEGITIPKEPPPIPPEPDNFDFIYTKF